MSSLGSNWHLYLFDKQGLDPGILEDTRASDSKSADRGRVICANCRELVTSTKEEIQKQGRHIHYCTNPHGYSFRFACYQDAPGCIGHGPASTEDSWFTAHSWRIALCASCAEHLGWLFEGETRFYGLILDRLIFDEPDLS